MNRSFHGRTFGAVTATGQDHYHEGLGDMLPNIKYADFNDIDSVKSAITDKTIAILLEPVQGEGGIIPAKVEFLKELRAICDEKDMLLMFDEVQCGVGRLVHFLLTRALVLFLMLCLQQRVLPVVFLVVL